MHYVLTIALLSLAFLLSAPDALAQWRRAKKATTPAAAAQSKRHMLWRVQSDSTVVYVMGSVHMLPKSYYPLDTILERSLDSSEVLVLEINLDADVQMSTAQKLMSSAMLEDGQTLATVLDKRTYRQVKSRMKALGLDVALFERFEPWMVALTLAGLELKSTGFTGDLGVDVHFSERALAESREVQGLETVEDQLELFDSMPLETQQTFLRQTLDGRDATSSMLKRLAAAWRLGDVNTLEKLALGEMKTDTAFYQRMLVKRNQAWLPKIETFLNDGARRYLVVVGAAHLLGPDGIIEMLRAKGYDPVQM